LRETQKCVSNKPFKAKKAEDEDIFDLSMNCQPIEKALASYE